LLYTIGFICVTTKTENMCVYRSGFPVCLSFQLSQVCVLFLIPSSCSRGAGVRYELGHPHKQSGLQIQQFSADSTLQFNKLGILISKGGHPLFFP
jgi:hypothetical protein